MKYILVFTILAILSCASSRPCHCTDSRIDMFMALQEKYGDSLSMTDKADLIRGEMTLDTMEMLVEEVRRATEWNRHWWVIKW